MTINDLKHPALKAWIEETAKMMQPDSVYICDGTQAEYVLVPDAHLLPTETFARLLTLAEQGGTVVNRVPHEAQAELEVRAFDSHRLTQVDTALRGLAGTAARAVRGLTTSST